jgi:ribonuclease P/MRP protein subunit RPP40
VALIYKKGDKGKCVNYRPVSLLNLLRKVFEKLVFKILFNYIRDNNIITPFQSGVPGDSATHQLVQLYHTLCESMDKGKNVKLVFCDITKAFDKVWHKGLLAKLKAIRVTGNLLDWFKSYLEGRAQRVVIEGEESTWAWILAGVPQGSVLGPLLFLIYINDICLTVKGNIRLFVDDTCLYLDIVHNVQTQTAVNSDLASINKWAMEWLVEFNPSKTVTMATRRPRTTTAPIPLEMDGVNLVEVCSHKHLGVTLQDNLRWDTHIGEIANKASKRTNILSTLKFKLDRETLEKMYFAFIRPILEYSGVLWDNCTKGEKELLEGIQKCAMRIVTGATPRASTALVCEEAGWVSLEKRRGQQKLILMYKILNSKTTPLMENLVPSPVSSRTGGRYGLRNQGDLDLPVANTELFKNSCLQSATKGWNQLPTEIKQSTSLGIFKTRLYKDNSVRNPLFNLGDRHTQIVMARLRMGCSGLNGDLHKYKLSPSKGCSCGADVEDALHFLLHCPKHTNLRTPMLNYVYIYIAPTVRNLLYGSLECDLGIRKLVYNKVIEFVKSTKRL